MILIKVFQNLIFLKKVNPFSFLFLKKNILIVFQILIANEELRELRNKVKELENENTLLKLQKESH